MDEKSFKASQVLALRAVEDPTFDDMFERIQHWYSSQYHIPIDRIETIPDEQIVKAWFVDRLTSMKNSSDEKIQHDYQTLKNSILFDEDQVGAEAEDVQWEEQMTNEIKREQGIVEPAGNTQEPNLYKDLSNNGRISGEEDYYVPED